jgi:hypothetical protein
VWFQLLSNNEGAFAKLEAGQINVEQFAKEFEEGFVPPLSLTHAHTHSSLLFLPSFLHFLT